MHMHTFEHTEHMPSSFPLEFKKCPFYPSRHVLLCILLYDALQEMGIKRLLAQARGEKKS